jgi:hypothetical protein
MVSLNSHSLNFKSRKYMKQLLTIALSAMILWTCSDDTVIQPTSDFQFDASYGMVVTDTLYPVDETFVVKEPISTGTSSRLSLGRMENFEAFFLIRFDDLPPDSVELDSVRMQLQGRGKLALSEQNELSIEVHELNDEWDSAANTDEAWRNYVPGSPYRSLSISLEDSLTYTIEIDNQLIKKWQNEDQNFGLLFRAAALENQLIKEFGSFNSETSKPRLVYKRLANGSSSHDTLAAGLDATIFTYSGSLFEEARQENHHVVSSGFVSRAFFKFDYSSIPKNILLSKAELHLPVAGENELLNPNKSQLFYLRSIVEAGADLSVDSTLNYDFNVNFVLSDEEGELVLSGDDAINFGQGYVQALVNGDLSHEWYSIQYLNENQSLSVMELLGTDAIPNARPRLIIRYLYFE